MNFFFLHGSLCYKNTWLGEGGIECDPKSKETLSQHKKEISILAATTAAAAAGNE